MRDWSRLLSSVAKLPYEQLVEKGKTTVNNVLDILARYSDTDEAPIILVGLAAYTAIVDGELSPIEVKLVEEIIGISEKDFGGFIAQVKSDNKIADSLEEIANCLQDDEMTELATLFSIIFAVDGDISGGELEFLKALCR